jgi:hypothetical protein
MTFSVVGIIYKELKILVKLSFTEKKIGGNVLEKILVKRRHMLSKYLEYLNACLGMDNLHL